MKKVSKKKTKSKKITRSKKGHYPVHFLVIVIAILISAESFFAMYTTGAEWKNAAKILDVSEGVSQTISDISYISQPMVSAASTVNEFYNQSAVAFTQLVQPNDYTDVTMFISGVNQFYSQATDQTIALLDLTNYNSWQAPPTPQIAGAYISR